MKTTNPTASFTPSKLNIEAVAEYALQQTRFPDHLRTDAHWLIANARLIASAPELLAALEFILNSMLERGYHERSACVLEARAAITKAKGPAPSPTGGPS